MIVVCGEALIDFTPVEIEQGQAYVPRPGGSTYNVAIGLARLGVDAAFLGRLSRDSFGRVLKDNLVENGVDTRLLIEADEPTTLAFVHLQHNSEPEFTFYNTGTADLNLRWEHMPNSLPSEAKALHFGSISTVLEPSASALEKLMRRELRQRVISFDPNIRPSVVRSRDEYVERAENLVALASIVKVSRADLQWLYPFESVKKIAERWRGMGPELVVITLGEDGAVAFCQSNVVGAHSETAQVKDTVGAGDAFTSGLLKYLYCNGLLDNRAALSTITEARLLDAIRFANAVAGLACERAGADSPFLEELEGRTG